MLTPFFRLQPAMDDSTKENTPEIMITSKSKGIYQFSCHDQGTALLFVEKDSLHECKSGETGARHQN